MEDVQRVLADSSPEFRAGYWNAFDRFERATSLLGQIECLPSRSLHWSSPWAWLVRSWPMMRRPSVPEKVD